MVEMLAVVAITVILLGISMVAVVRYRDLLKLTELDNAAREIYMAAENRAVLLSGARRLGNQVDKANGKPTSLTKNDHSADEVLYYVSRASVGEELLTVGSIDPALRDGDFYIVYDKNSGSVTDVFYAESSLSGLVENDFAAFYDKWANSRSVRLELKNVKLVGWYNGRAAQGRDEKLDPPDESIVKVIIKNEEELTVTVEYSAPAPAKLSVKLGGIALSNERLVDAHLPDGDISVLAGTGSYTWVLDSLTAGQFKELKKADGAYIVTPGDNFTVEATLTPQTSGDFDEASDSGTNNSLFQEGSDGDTAYIKYLRHLQNLDTGFSGVTETKTKAVQTADIYCHGDGAYEAYKDYNFIPINNDNLTSYKAQFDSDEEDYYRINNLNIENPGKSAGLFSEVKNTMALQNIRLVNATVDAASDSAGALVGEVSADAAIQNCRAYWEPYGTVTDLQAVLGSDKDGQDNYNYQIKGQSAGGLIGKAASGKVTITNSLAATLVHGKLSAGGLIGTMEADSSAEVKYSYADCYIKADPPKAGGSDESAGGGNAAGLIGSAGTVTLVNCYAAGYIMDGAKAAGLCLGGGTTTTENVYSVMRIPSQKKDADNGAEVKWFYFLTENCVNDGLDVDTTYFLGTESQSVQTEGGTIDSTRYADMTNRGDADGNDNFAKTMGGVFEWKASADSSPYNLREHLTLRDYSFPGLKNLPHYGDWGAEFKEPSLVYYEQYSGDDWGVSGGNARDLINNLSDTKTILSDGYGVAFLRDDLKGENVTVTVTCSDENGSLWESDKYTKDTLTKTAWANDDGSIAEYYMIPLSDELVNSVKAKDCFYRYLKFELDLGGGGEKSTGEYFYNPHFAETVVPVISENSTGGWTPDAVTKYAAGLAASMDEVKLRTPRHLYDLSQFEEYYHNARGDTFRQVLDLDYASYGKIWDLSVKNQDSANPVYIEYGTTDKLDENGNVVEKGHIYAKQQPIGSYAASFTGTYNGDCNVIRNVVPEVSNLTQRQYAGLFGYSKGTLRNIVYEMDPACEVMAYLSKSANNLYVGALAGGSEGTVENCAVYGANLRAGASTVNIYVGGLVGRNNGVIRNSAAEFARLSANCFSSARVYIGGLVGENTAARTITTSYAVGRIDAEIGSTIKDARICGFVGWNSGSISNSYAAVDLKSSGEGVVAYGFCGQRAGSQSGTKFLDQGNFTYRETAYAANYRKEGDRAASTTYLEMIEDNVPGMKTIWTGTEPAEDVYPYPAVVKNKAGEYVHYGLWPKPMPLGDMGVFYWEKMVDADWQKGLTSGGNGNPTYHISALAVDPGDGTKQGTITKQSTLSEAHNDGRVVVDYGYGYYAESNRTVSLTTGKIAYIKYQSYEPRSSWLNPEHKDFEEYGNQADANGVRTVDKWPQNDEANKALNTLMNGYNFHCWNTYREAPKKADNNKDDYRSNRAKSGLCLVKDKQGDVLEANDGSFTLKQDNLELKFIVNPQFADAISVDKNKKGSLSCDEVLEVNPGGEKNPYQIRSGLQLQDINWYDTAYTDVPVGYSSYDVKRFPYLSGEKYPRNYYWKQTHDIDWVAERKSYDLPSPAANDDGVFFPIAQCFAKDGSGTLNGWFGGTYDGGNYTIKNLNIGINVVNYQVNCMGLFGAVQGAVLENIVMYSESGNDAITVYGRSTNTRTTDKDPGLIQPKDGWYAGGVLVGLARTVKGEDGKPVGRITNCAVAGYSIKDVTEQARINSNDMGGAIGGLVGMTDMDLSGCSAIVTIDLTKTVWIKNGSNAENVEDYNHSRGGESAPIRVGGLVGSTTGSVTNCYTGGEIVVSEKANSAAVYAGRIIGGVGMEPFGVTDDTATIENCYSYLTLPKKGGVVKEVYNIGGEGRTDNTGNVELKNDYYLSGTADDKVNERSITYRQLAGDDLIDGQTIYQKLNGKADKEGEASYNPYYPVTSVVEGLAMGGRFSYAPKNRQDLQGLDYPFPTVLHQTRVSDGRVFRVHYGGWELNGIERANGGTPIYLDMFKKQSASEELTLSKDITPFADGAWTAWVVADNGAIVEPKVKGRKDDSEKADLTVTAKRVEPNGHPVAVTVWYGPKSVIDQITADKSLEDIEAIEGIEQCYSLTVDVYITDIVALRPNKVSIFPNDVVDVTLKVVGTHPDDPNVADEARPVLTTGTLTLVEVSSSAASLAAEQVKTEDGQPAAPPAIRLTPDEEFTTGTQVNVTYTYEQDGYSVTRTEQIDVTLLELPEGKWEEKDGTRTWTMDLGSKDSVYKGRIKDLTASLADSTLKGFTVNVENGIVTLAQETESDELPEDGIDLKITMETPSTPDAPVTEYVLSHDLTVTVYGPKAGEERAGSTETEVESAIGAGGGSTAEPEGESEPGA